MHSSYLRKQVPTLMPESIHHKVQRSSAAQGAHVGMTSELLREREVSELINFVISKVLNQSERHFFYHLHVLNQPIKDVLGSNMLWIQLLSPWLTITLYRGCYGNRLWTRHLRGNSSPAMACGSDEYSCTSTTPQSSDAFSFFSFEADGATLKRPCIPHRKRMITLLSNPTWPVYNCCHTFYVCSTSTGALITKHIGYLYISVTDFIKHTLCKDDW